MSKFMQSASALTLAVALSAVPLAAQAQQAGTTGQTEVIVQGNETSTGQALDNAGQSLENAAESTGQAIENAAGATGQAIENAAQGTERAVEGTVQSETVITGTTVQPVTTEQTGQAVVVEGAAPVEEVPGAIVMQDEDSLLVSELMDATVYNEANEKIGEIDDAIVSLNGSVEGVVIGVGGFLGIGEKHVAVQMQEISVRMDANNQPQLILNSTKEALEAAPEFVTAEQQRRETDQQTLQQQAPAGGATTGMSTSDVAPAASTTVGGQPAPAEVVTQPTTKN